MIAQTDLAYCAGIVDGEGCLRIKRTSPYRKTTGRVSPGYHASIHVRMVDESAIAFLKETVGGWYWKERPPTNRRRAMYCWQATDAACERIVSALLPFLKTKRPQAGLLLRLRALQAGSQKHRTKVTGYREFQGYRGGVRRVRNLAYSDEYLARCQALYVAGRDLNRVGP